MVAGVAGSGVPAGVAAVALNVTVVTPSAPGFLTVYPAGVPRPTASSLNFVPGQVVPNNVIVKTGALDAIDLYASNGCPQVVVDVVGFFDPGPASPGGFTGVTPFRVADTRETGGCVTAGAPRRVPVGGVTGSGVPTGAAAVALNVTVVAPRAAGFLTVYPAGVARPTASTLNYVAGQIVPNGTVVKLGTADAVDIYALDGCPDVVVDVVGYFAAGSPTLGGAFTGVTPFRLLDSRGSGSCVTQAAPRRLQVAGVPGSGVPAGAAAVALNVTVVSPSAPGFVTVYPAGVDRPTASTLNYVAGDVVPNGALVRVGAGDAIDIYALAGCPNVVVDVVGYFLADHSVVQVSTGLSHACAVRADGRVACWGRNDSGQLGDGSTTSSTVPVAVPGVWNAVQVSAGFHHTCAARDDGHVVCWGDNAKGELGNGSTTNSLTAVMVAGVSTAVQVAAGYDFSCALLEDGTARCWGANSLGQVGNDAPANSSVPVTVPATVVGLAGAVQISAGNAHACAVIDDGTVDCWGSNSGAQLGDGTFVDSPVPVEVLDLTTAVEVAAGSAHSCALLDDGSVACWGDGSSGQLGAAGLVANSAVPLPVVGLTTAVEIAAGGSDSCALRLEGTTVCWGANGWGQLGNGSTVNSQVPVGVTGISNAVQVATGYGFSCALLDTPSVTCWGYNGWGQLGNGSTANSTTPVGVTGL